MFGYNSNIFVSISPSYDYDFNPERKKKCMRPHHHWMLSVESTKYSLPGTNRRDPNPIHYSVVWDDEESQCTLQKVLPTNLGIIGSILIQRNAPMTAPKLFQRLEADLHDLPSKLDGSDDSEHWMRSALYALQLDKIVQEFDVEMFMTFSQAYLARRMDGDGPARIAYSRLHRDHSQKEKKSFWVSHPRVTANYDRSNVYGGLM